MNRQFMFSFRLKRCLYQAGGGIHGIIALLDLWRDGLLRWHDQIVLLGLVVAIKMLLYMVVWNKLLGS